MSIPARSVRLLESADIHEGDRIIVAADGPTESTVFAALGEVLFIGGHSFDATNDGGTAGPLDGWSPRANWETFEAVGDVTAGVRAIVEFVRGAGATRVEVYAAPATRPEDIPVVGPLVRGTEAAASAAEGIAASTQAFATGLQSIAGLLPVLIVGLVVFLVVTGGVKVRL